MFQLNSCICSHINLDAENVIFLISEVVIFALKRRKNNLNFLQRVSHEDIIIEKNVAQVKAQRSEQTRFKLA